MAIDIINIKNFIAAGIKFIKTKSTYLKLTMKTPEK